MPLEQVRIDENKSDDALPLIERDPRLARPPAIADQCVERFLAFQRIDESRDLRRERQEQRVDLGGVVDRSLTEADAGHPISPTRRGRARTSAASIPLQGPA